MLKMKQTKKRQSREKDHRARDQAVRATWAASGMSPGAARRRSRTRPSAPTPSRSTAPPAGAPSGSPGTCAHHNRSLKAEQNPTNRVTVYSTRRILTIYR